MSVVGLMLDVLIVLLLMVTIGYCWLLNRRIRVLQDSKSELAQLLKHFDESTQRASDSIIGLQSASKKIGENIQMRIEKANFLLDDLAFMIEKGHKLTNQMEAGFAVTRARARALTEDEPKAIEVAEEEALPQPMPVIEKFIPKPAEKTISQRDKTTATLEAVLDRIVGRGKTPANDVEETRQRDRKEPKQRSRAEQELLDMIKAGIKG
jgi:hypothetical protein